MSRRPANKTVQISAKGPGHNLTGPQYFDLLKRRMQPLDGDLTSIAGQSATNCFLYRHAENDWRIVGIGQGLIFVGGILSGPRLSGAQLDDVSASNILSNSTVDLSSREGQIDVTGTTTINAFTLAEGQEVIVRFTDVLTLTNSATLVCPGGHDIETAAGAWALLHGGAAGVVTIVQFQLAGGFARQTFDNLFMNPGANIGYADVGSPFFEVGRGENPNGTFWRFTFDANPSLLKNDLSAGIEFDLSELVTQTRILKLYDADGQLLIVEGTRFVRLDGTALTDTRQYVAPDKDGTLAMLDDIPSAPLMRVTGATRFDAAAGAIANDVVYGVISGIGRRGDGFYRVTFTESEPDTAYFVTVTCGDIGDSAGYYCTVPLGGQQVDYLDIHVFDSTGTLHDVDNVMVQVSRIT